MRSQDAHELRNSFLVAQPLEKHVPERQCHHQEGELPQVYRLHHPAVGAWMRGKHLSASDGITQMYSVSVPEEYVDVSQQKGTKICLETRAELLGKDPGSVPGIHPQRASPWTVRGPFCSHGITSLLGKEILPPPQLGKSQSKN